VADSVAGRFAAGRFSAFHTFGVSRIEVVSGDALYSSRILPRPPEPLCARSVKPSFLSFGARIIWACSSFIIELNMKMLRPFSRVMKWWIKSRVCLRFS